MLVPSLCMYANHPAQVDSCHLHRSPACWFMDYDILRGQLSAKGATVLCLER
jgi:hypothetical protein